MKPDFETRGIPRRYAYELIQGYVMCNVIAALDEAGLIPALLGEGLRADQLGSNEFLSDATVGYLIDRGIIQPEGDGYRATPFGSELLRDSGYIFWVAGGFGFPFHRFGGLISGAETYGKEVSRDGRLVAVASAELGRGDLKPYVDDMLASIEFRRVADFGCGNARNLIGICRAAGTDGLGVDISPDAIAEARLELDREGLAGRIRLAEADASDAASIPGLETVDLVVGFFFMHEVLAKGYDEFVGYLRGIAGRLPAGAHVLAAEVTPPVRNRASQETFTPEFTLIHAMMGQGLLSEEEWCQAFREGGFAIERTLHPHIPGGLVLLARNEGGE
jgi:SAM-dependent methyltransferase